MKKKVSVFINKVEKGLSKIVLSPLCSTMKMSFRTLDQAIIFLWFNG